MVMELTQEMRERWLIVLDELSYTGAIGPVVRASLDARFGSGKWVAANFFAGQVQSRREAIRLYEDAYYEHLKAHPDVLEWLVETASDVYDLAESNVESGDDYGKQECQATHLQDIAIRRALKRLGRRFEGDHLVRIRDRASEGYRLQPGLVPFHRLDLLRRDGQVQRWRNKGGQWWADNSIEDFYQNTKALLVMPESLVAAPDVAGNGEIFLRQTKQHYYRSDLKNLRLLHYFPGRFVRSLVSGKDKSHRRLRGAKPEPYLALAVELSSYQSQAAGG